MAILGKLFGTKKDYTPLDPSHPLSNNLDNLRQPLEALSLEVNDQLEVVPSKDSAIVFIGKPPKKFGIAWVQDGEVHNIKTVAEEKAIAPEKLQKVSEELRQAYVRSKSDARYAATLGDRTLVVADSEALEEEVRGIIETLDT